MVQTNQPTPEDLFTDAEQLLQQALKQLDAGDIRDASEKAWGATVAATKGMVIKRTGRIPDTSARVTVEFGNERARDPALRPLYDAYRARRDALHGQCFYDGFCEPRAVIEDYIRETLQYLEDARRLGNGK